MSSDNEAKQEAELGAVVEKTLEGTTTDLCVSAPLGPGPLATQHEGCRN
jgi:hypothetical protein